MSLDKEKHIFWLDNPKILYEDGNYVKFIPQYTMSRSEQLNAISRFSIYMIILLLAFNKNKTWFYLPIILLFTTIAFYYAKENDSLDDRKELRRILSQRSDIKQAEYQKFLDYGGQPEISKENVSFDEDTENDEIEIQSGYYDSSGNLITGKKVTAPKYTQNPPESLYSIDELIEYEKASCRNPSNNNPFMNPNITEYNNGMAPMACNIEDEDIAENISVNFNKDLYRNIDDLFDKKNSQRQFYTLPSTGIPNNQREHANFRYKIRYSYKEDQGKNPIYYEDLRFKRLRGNRI